jgi:cytochrome c biogenesis protein CcdA
MKTIHKISTYIIMFGWVFLMIGMLIPEHIDQTYIIFLGILGIFSGIMVLTLGGRKYDIMWLKIDELDSEIKKFQEQNKLYEEAKEKLINKIIEEK